MDAVHILTLPIHSQVLEPTTRRRAISPQTQEMVSFTLRWRQVDFPGLRSSRAAQQPHNPNPDADQTASSSSPGQRTENGSVCASLRPNYTHPSIQATTRLHKPIKTQVKSQLKRLLVPPIHPSPPGPAKTPAQRYPKSPSLPQTHPGVTTRPVTFVCQHRLPSSATHRHQKTPPLKRGVKV